MERPADRRRERLSVFAVGLAGLALFGFGLVVLLAPLSFLPEVNGSMSLELLGRGFAIPYLVALAVWQLAALSLAGGWMVMTWRSRKLALMAAATWTALGLLAAIGGANPGLLLLFGAASAVLWLVPEANLS
jgi:hypothetical protein